MSSAASALLTVSTPLFQVLLLPILLGVAGNYAYAAVEGYRSRPPANWKRICGIYKCYWYNTSRASDTEGNPIISSATVTIKRNYKFQTSLIFQQDKENDDDFDDYLYEGLVTFPPGQMHWTMHGRNHDETCYVIFARGASRNLNYTLKGLMLVTSIDLSRQPTSIRCVLARESMDAKKAGECIGISQYFTILADPRKPRS